jgi:hypothetical protein
MKKEEEKRREAELSKMEEERIKKDMRRMENLYER